MRLHHRKLFLAASCSFAALLVGTGAPAAMAACSINDLGVTVAAVSNPGAINCIAIQNSTVTGNVTNTKTGVISAVGTNGITIDNSTIGGAIINNGIIIANTANGIEVAGHAVVDGGISNSGTISAGIVGILALGLSTFSGGISNTGTMSGGGINVELVSSFSGGITNSGKISGSGIGVVSVSTFSDGISNSGTISAVHSGISVGSVPVFSGGIGNSGTISAKTGIVILNNVTFAPGSAIVNSGTIIGTTAAIDASAATSPVTIDQTGGLISGAIKLSANAADTLNISGGTIAGNIVGSAAQSDTLNFALGSGTFTYGPGFGFTNISQVNVNSGLVILDGINTAANVTINGGTLEIGDAANTGATLTSTNTVNVDGGTLAGHGTLVGNAIIGNGGTLMPGGSIGTLTINGNLSFNSGSTYLVSLSPAQNSLTNVTGTVMINGGTVELNPQVASYKPGTTYTILTSTGALTGTFNPTVTFANPVFQLIDPTLTDDAHDVFLTEQGAKFVAPAGASLNAQNALAVINTALANGTNVPSAFFNLANFSGAAFNAAANQLGGQTQGSFAPVAFEAGNQFLNLLLNPFLDGRLDPANGGPPLAYVGDQPAPAAQAFSALALGPAAIFAPKMSFWSAAYGGGGTIQGNATTGAATTYSQIYGAVTGLDYRLSPDTVVGFALGGGGTAWQLNQGLGSGHSGMFQAGLYGTTHFGPAAYVSGAASYSLQAVTTDRFVPLDSSALQGNFDANMFSGRVESGYRLSTGDVAVTPYGALQMQAIVLPGYSEFALSGPGTSALTYAGRTSTDTRTELGLWLDSDKWAAQGVKVYGRVAWAHDFTDEGNSTVFFQSLPGTSFLVNTTQPANDSALVTAGVDYKFAPGWSLTAKFDGEYSKTTAIFAGTAAVRYAW